jgi:hypothetical protein
MVDAPRKVFWIEGEGCRGCDVFFVTSLSVGLPYSVVWSKKAGIPGQGDPTGESPRDGSQRQSPRKNPVASTQEQAQTGQNFSKEAGNNILWQLNKSNRRR